MKKKLINGLKYLLFLSLGVFLIWWSIHKMDDQNWNACKDAMRDARFKLFIPVFFILILSHFSRAIRWNILMQTLGYRPRIWNTFFAVMIGYLANMAIPRLGEVLKCTIISKYEKVPVDKLVGTILIERAVDMVSLLIVFAIALITQADVIGTLAINTFKEQFLTGSIQSILLHVSLFFAILLAVYFIGKFFLKRFAHIAIIEKIKKVLIGIKLGLSSIGKLENKGWFLFHSVLIWIGYAAGTYIGFYAIEQTAHLPVAATFPVLAFASIGMIITPGGIGGYPFFVAQVMELYQIPYGLGYANGTLQWIAQGVIIMIIGFISTLLLPRYNQHRLPK